MPGRPKMTCKICSFEMILYIPVNNISVILGLSIFMLIKKQDDDDDVDDES